MAQIVHGWRFPDGCDVPDRQAAPALWSSFESRGEEVSVPNASLVMDVGRQLGCVWGDPKIIVHDTRVAERSSMSDDGGSEKREEMPYVAVKHTVRFDGETHARIGSTDASTNGLEDMVSTAETKALKRTIQSAVGIWRIGGRDHATTTNR